MLKSRISFNEDGLVCSVSEEEFDHGHSEGGFVSRDNPNFEKYLREFLICESYFELIRLIDKADRDPLLGKVLGELFLYSNDKAKLYIEEARKRREAKLKEEESRKSKQVDLSSGNKSGRQRKWIGSGKVENSFYR